FHPAGGGVADLLGECGLVGRDRAECRAQPCLLVEVPGRAVGWLGGVLGVLRHVARLGPAVGARSTIEVNFLLAAKLSGNSSHLVADRRQPVAARDLAAGEREVMVRIAEQLNGAAVALIRQLELRREVLQLAGAQNAKAIPGDGSLAICVRELLKV